MDQANTLSTIEPVADTQGNASKAQYSSGIVIESDKKDSATENQTIKQESSEEEDTSERQNKRKRRDSNSTDVRKDSNEQFVAKKVRKGVESEGTYSLFVTNFPSDWSYQQINDYVSQALEGMSVKTESEPTSGRKGARLTFKSVAEWLSAQEELRSGQVEGNQLKVEPEGANNDSDSDSASQETEVIPKIPTDAWDDPNGLYGLKPEFLATLNITPPLSKWIHVNNFRCDKTELKDALELAGTVVACSVINVPSKYANVMYSHPLEAVQAVSMLHDQMFYGKKLHVTMDKASSAGTMLPKGLSDVGPGLGEDGIALREIAREYERLLDGKSTKVNLSLFVAGNVNGIVIPSKLKHTPIGVKKPQTTEDQSQFGSTPVCGNTMTPTVRAPIRSALNVRPGYGQNVRPPVQYEHVNPYVRANVPMYGAPIRANPLMMQGAEMHQPRQMAPGYGMQARMPMQFVQSVPGPISAAVSMTAPVPPGVTPNWLNPQNTGLAPQMLKGPDPSILKITNLPPSTSFSSLCGKLSTLAQVTSLEFTTPGCAVVRFASPAEAEKCFQKYRTIQLS